MRRKLLSIVNNAVPNNEIWYTTINNNTILPDATVNKVISNTYNNNKGVLVFESEVTILERNFFRESSLETITLPNSVKIIDSLAFANNKHLKSITLSSNLERIEVGAFSGCSNLSKLPLFDKVTYIGNAAFQNSGLEYIKIPNSVTYLGEAVFENCKRLDFVRLPNIDTIKKRLFNGCILLSNVNIPQSITTIEDQAFKDCKLIYYVDLPNSITNISNTAFDGCRIREFRGKFASEDRRCLIIDGTLIAFTLGYNQIDTSIPYALPSEIETITTHTFYDYGIYNLSLSENVTTIEEDAFYNTSTNILGRKITINSNIITSERSFINSHIKEVVVGDTVTRIKKDLFKDCKNVDTIIIGENVEEIGAYAFYNVNPKTVVIFKGDIPPRLGTDVFGSIDNLQIIVPKGAEKEYLLSGWNTEYIKKIKGLSSALEKHRIAYKGTLVGVYPEGTDGVITHSNGTIIFENIITEIPDGIFENQTGLTSITLPGSVVNIGNSAFKGCSSLVGTFNTIPPFVESIGEEAFSGCSKLKNINLPNTIKTLGNYAFHNCGNLTVKCFCQTPPIIGDSTFDIGNVEIWILSTKYEVYSNSNIWKDYNDYFILMDTKGNRVQSKKEIWYETTSGIKLNINNSDIKSHTFQNKIGYITFNEELKKVPNSIFANCKTLKYVSIPSSVEEIGEGAFSGCSSLNFEQEDITRVTTIPGNKDGFIGGETGNGFIGSSSNLNVRLPNSITTIGNQAFAHCTSITGISLNNVTSFGIGAFESCIKMENFNIPSKVKEISDKLFLGCTSLSSVNITNNISRIGSDAFSGCELLENITIPSSIIEIGSNAFGGTTNIKKVNIQSLQDWCKIDFRNEKANPIYNGAILYVGTEAIKGGLNITTDVHQYAFVGYKHISSLTITDVNIGDFAFGYCDNLKTLTISSYAIFNRYSFYESKIEKSNIIIEDLESYSIANAFYVIPGKKELYNAINQIYSTLEINTRIIGHFAFYNSNIVKNVILGEDVEAIGDSAFAECDDLESIYCKPVIPPILGNTPFELDVPIYIKGDHISNYFGSQWKDYNLQLWS